MREDEARRFRYDPWMAIEAGYDPVLRPAADRVSLVQNLLRSYDSLGAFDALRLSDIEFSFVRGLKGHLARYIDGSVGSTPHFVIDFTAHVRSADKHGVALDDGLTGTLLHEAGHAFYDAIGMHGFVDEADEENAVEGFAHAMWQLRPDLAVARLLVPVAAHDPVEAGRQLSHMRLALGI